MNLAASNSSGSDPLQIEVALHGLLGDAQFWASEKSYAPSEAAVRLHHRLVKIHPFPNGNGRHARIMADTVLDRVYGAKPIDWAGGHDLQKMNERRAAYIAALRLYAQYFNEDNFYGVGEAMSAAEKATLRTRIRLLAIVSMIFATVVAPWLCGFLSAFYLTKEQFLEFVWFLMVVKSLLIAKALYELREHAWFIDTSNSFKFLVLIY